MRVLLDTSALLWWLADDDRLGSRARAAIASADTEVLVSAASAWEIAVKRAAGKLEARFDVAEEIERNEFLELPIGVAHAVASAALPPHHRDPFDRLLVAQAQIESARLVSDDAAIARYAVDVLDASR